MNTNETIFAPATAPGKSGVAIVRVSGPEARAVITAFTGEKNISPRYAHFTSIAHPKTREKIDDAIVIFFEGPNSFTGEDVVEFHIHGSRAVMTSLLIALSEQNGLRPAEKGEFSRRAFENGRMDLTQVEGLADLIDAETEMQHRQALRQMEGELGKLYEEWRAKLIETLAHVEAYIDFPDEDLPEELKAEFLGQAEALKTSLTNHINDKRGEVLRRGVFITILGAPNSGKSTLLNWLAKRDVAIVSHIAGTTRDVIEVEMDIEGYPVTVCDTAGLRETDDVIESEGIRRALERSKMADLKILLFDAATWPDRLDPETEKCIDDNSIALLTKNDGKNEVTDAVMIGNLKALPISVKEGEGLERLINLLADKIDSMISPGADPVFTRERHRLHLSESLLHIEKFSSALEAGAPVEIAAEEVRLAARSLGEITGKIDVEQILDAIFSKFCIGK